MSNATRVATYRAKQKAKVERYEEALREIAANPSMLGEWSLSALAMKALTQQERK